MANITPKGNGTYLIRISCGSDSSGKSITKSKIFKPSNRAVEQFNELLAQNVKMKKMIRLRT